MRVFFVWFYTVIKTKYVILRRSVYLTICEGQLNTTQCIVVYHSYEPRILAYIVSLLPTNASFSLAFFIYMFPGIGFKSE